MRKKQSDSSKEGDAIQTCGEALEGLKPAGQQRVLHYLNDRFGDADAPAEKPRVASVSSKPGITTSPKRAAARATAFESFAELHDAAGPKTDKERVLVASYWEQFGAEPTETFSAHQANKHLKDIGHSPGNITMAFNGLKAEKPSLVIQLKKSSKARQGRKTLKVTDAGKKYVEALIRTERPGDDEAK